MTNIFLAMPQAATNENEHRRKRRGYRMAEPPKALFRFYSSSPCDIKKDSFHS